jgi:drug/metabolite transporter (DMT)-like permease
MIAGVLVALMSAAAYAFGVTLQSLEARETPGDEALKLSLLTDLLHRKRWLGGTACVMAGWALQAAALLLAPLSVVQPALAASVVVLLIIGMRMHDESIGAPEVIGAVAIMTGVIGLAAVSPNQSESHAAPVTLAIGMSILGLVALVPFAICQGGKRWSFLVAIGAGIAYAWTGFSTKFLTDGFSKGHIIVAFIWLAATAGAAGVGLLSEMTALQTRSAIRVFPIVLVVQIVVAVLLAPLLAGEQWHPSPINVAILTGSLLAIGAGTRLLAGARAVNRVVATSKQTVNAAPAAKPSTSAV